MKQFYVSGNLKQKRNYFDNKRFSCLQIYKNLIRYQNKCILPREGLQRLPRSEARARSSSGKPDPDTKVGGTPK